jgi:hypothetical protein
MVMTIPMAHLNWTRMMPTVQRAERYMIRSILWIRKDIGVE